MAYCKLAGPISAQITDGRRVGCYQTLAFAANSVQSLAAGCCAFGRRQHCLSRAVGLQCQQQPFSASGICLPALPGASGQGAAWCCACGDLGSALTDAWLAGMFPLQQHAAVPALLLYEPPNRHTGWEVSGWKNLKRNERYCGLF